MAPWLATATWTLVFIAAVKSPFVGALVRFVAVAVVVTASTVPMKCDPLAKTVAALLPAMTRPFAAPAAACGMPYSATTAAPVHWMFPAASTVSPSAGLPPACL